jgi:hypothetical protein
MVRMLRDDQSLDSAWADLTFTEARLPGDANAKEFAPTFTQLRQRLEEVRGGQHGTWREELVAQAAVSAADDALDDWVHDLDVALPHLVAGDTQSPPYRRYFATVPSALIRMGLESELGRVRAWPDSLAGESDAELKSLADRLRTLIAQGEAALEARRKASAERSDHRVRPIASLIDDLNNARLSLYGNLARKAAELRPPIRTAPVERSAPLVGLTMLGSKISPEVSMRCSARRLVRPSTTSGPRATEEQWYPPSP